MLKLFSQIVHMIKFHKIFVFFLEGLKDNPVLSKQCKGINKLKSTLVFEVALVGSKTKENV